MRKLNFLFILMIALYVTGCTSGTDKAETQNPNTQDTFKYQTEQFADIRILRYQVPGFNKLTAKQKELCYYMEQAAYAGREIFYDQNFKYNLAVKRTFEGIIENYKGNRNNEHWKNFMEYTKRVWFSNGIHHHYSNEKMIPAFSPDYLRDLILGSPDFKLPLEDGDTRDYFIQKLKMILFDGDYASKRLNSNTEEDIVATSATNYYDDVTQKEAEDFYDKMTDKNYKTPISYGLNSKLVKKNGKLEENTYRIGGMYTVAIEEIVKWLSKAVAVAENDTQKQAIEKLIEFYQTGDLKLFDQYNEIWVKDTSSIVDFTNGFIEVYGDPLGRKGAWQSVVYLKDVELTKQFGVLGSDAAWFEKNSTIADEFKRENPQGVSYRVVNVVTEAGDCSPSTPIGVNLPNSNWIRATYGSKSVSLGNIEEAYNQASKQTGVMQEFSTPEQIELMTKYGDLAGRLHTGLHEVVGHGSGKIKAGVGTPSETLKNFASTMEEARADLVALYFIMDQHLVEKGLIPTTDVGKAEYCNFMVNGLMRQLSRIAPGANVEESHMRNRQLIAKWCFEKGKKDNVIEKKTIDGKTYFVINDYDKLRTLVGELLKEVQRIKSEGDFNAAKTMVETYAVKVDADLHKEVLERYKKLNIAPYAGFINPRLVPVMQGDKVIDVKLEYFDDFTKQMLWYSKEYRILPNYN